MKLIFADEALRTDPTVARWLAEVEKDESVEGIFLVEDITNYGAGPINGYRELRLTARVFPKPVPATQLASTIPPET